MSGYYTKLDSGITDSTIWQAPDTTRLVWITMLAMADQYGYIGASLPGLASRARVSLPACAEAIEAFKSPDQYSRTKDHDGRRIAESDGGWVLLNHAKYRSKISADDRRERSRVAMAELRARRRSEVSTEANGGQQKLTVNDSEPALTKLPQAEAEAEAEAKAEKKNQPPTKMPKAERGARLSKDWLLPRSWGDWALAKYPHWSADIVRDIALSFRNYWAAKTGKDATKLDWEMTWQNNCMSAMTQRQYPPPRQAQPMSFREREAEAAAQHISRLTGGIANAPLRDEQTELIDVDAKEIHSQRLA